MAEPQPCPYCGAQDYRLRDPRWLVCRSCGGEFDLQRDLCRSCGRVNRAEDRACAQCGRPLGQGTVDTLIAERGKDRRAWFRERATAGLEMKATDNEASRQRMEAYLAEDRAIQSAHARALSERRQSERRLVIAAIVVAAVFIAVILILALLDVFRGRPEAVSLIRGAAPRAGSLALCVALRTGRTDRA